MNFFFAIFAHSGVGTFFPPSDEAHNSVADVHLDYLEDFFDDTLLKIPEERQGIG